MSAIDEHQIATSDDTFCAECGALTDGPFCTRCGAHTSGPAAPDLAGPRRQRRFQSSYPPPPSRTQRPHVGAAALAAVVGIVAIVAAAVVVVLTNSSTPPATKSATTTPAVAASAKAPDATASPEHRRKPKVRTVVKTVTAPSTTVVEQGAAAGASPASPALAPACGDPNISINGSTSCGFADNVFAQYAGDVQQGGAASYEVYATSPATGATYTDDCQLNSTTQLVDCSHGSDLVQFPEWAAAVYNPAGR
jgi:hypothetical protein